MEDSLHSLMKTGRKILGPVLFVLLAAFFLAKAGYSDPAAFRLIGTVEGKEAAGAVISDAAGNQSFYRLRELLPDGSQVVKVESDSIMLRRSDGTTYDLYIHDPRTAAQMQSSVNAGVVPVPPAQAAPRVEERSTPAPFRTPAPQTTLRPRKHSKRSDQED